MTRYKVFLTLPTRLSMIIGDTALSICDMKNHFEFSGSSLPRLLLSGGAKVLKQRSHPFRMSGIVCLMRGMFRQ